MRYTAAYKATNQWGKIHSLLVQLNKKIFLFTLAVLVVFIVSSKAIAGFLKISSPVPLFILACALLFAFAISINRGVMQGLEDFINLSLNFSLEALLKVVLVVVLIFAGLTVNRAIWAIFVAVLVAYAFSYFPLKRVFAFEDGSENLDLKEIIISTIPILLSFLFITLLYNQDVILVKHFFSAHEAGQYAGLALMGKIILFASLAIAAAMFPIVSGAHHVDEKHGHILGQSLVLVLLIAVGVDAIYFLFPKIFIKIFFGSQYLGVSSYLGYFGLVMVLLSLIITFVYYFLATHKAKFIIFLGGCTLLQTLLLWFFHDSIRQVIVDLLITMVLLLIFMVISYWKDTRVTAN